MKKIDVHAACLKHLDNKLKDLHGSLRDVQEAIEGEEKNTAGDKYETARAIAQEEADRLRKQIAIVNQELVMLQNPSANRDMDTVQACSLIETKDSWYYLGPAIGRLQVGEKTVTTISPRAPIAQQMLGKKPGDSFEFNNNSFEIKSIS